MLYRIWCDSPADKKVSRSRLTRLTSQPHTFALAAGGGSRIPHWKEHPFDCRTFPHLVDRFGTSTSIPRKQMNSLRRNLPPPPKKKERQRLKDKSEFRAHGSLIHRGRAGLLKRNTQTDCILPSEFVFIAANIARIATVDSHQPSEATKSLNYYTPPSTHTRTHTPSAKLRPA